MRFQFGSWPSYMKFLAAKLHALSGCPGSMRRRTTSEACTRTERQMLIACTGGRMSVDDHWRHGRSIGILNP